jgi:hypothetical protein
MAGLWQNRDYCAGGGGTVPALLCVVFVPLDFLCLAVFGAALVPPAEGAGIFNFWFGRMSAVFRLFAARSSLVVT